jgi:hypothetical protein
MLGVCVFVGFAQSPTQLHIGFGIPTLSATGRRYTHSQVLRARFAGLSRWPTSKRAEGPTLRRVCWPVLVAEQFEGNRTRLRAVAYRCSDRRAERMTRAGLPASPQPRRRSWAENLTARLTTVVARQCWRESARRVERASSSSHRVPPVGQYVTGVGKERTDERTRLAR